MSTQGLKKEAVEVILREKIESNPDLKYYIDNEYIMMLLDLLIEGIGEVIEKNNKELADKLSSKR